MVYIGDKVGIAMFENFQKLSHMRYDCFSKFDIICADMFSHMQLALLQT